MAKDVTPGTPPTIEAKLVDVKTPSFKAFDELGDAKIKAANQNFKLYAETLITTESAKLYEQYKTDPIQLSNALGKLPEMINDLPDEIQNEMNLKLYQKSVSLVEKAEDNRQQEEKKQSKIYALNLAKNTNESISTDFFNILKNMVAAPEDVRDIYNDIYVGNRLSLRQLADSIDGDGNYLFTESQRKAMQMPKESSVNGFKQFINRFETKELKEFYQKQFANRDEFKRKTLIDDETYDSMETALKSRIQALENDDIVKIHGQAYYDAATLITEPTQVNIDRAKSEGIIKDKTIDKIVKASQEATSKTYAYDPTRRTSPGAFMQALANFSHTVNNTDWSPEGREETIGQAADTLLQLSRLAEETNMSPELVDTIKSTIRETITNKQAATAFDLAKSLFNNEDMYRYANPDDQGVEYTYMGKKSLSDEGVEQAKKIALKNYENNVIVAMNSFLQGNYDLFQAQLTQANKQFKYDQVSFMPFTRQQWEQWEKDVENGKYVVIEYMGNQYEFHGFNAQKPFDLTSFI